MNEMIKHGLLINPERVLVETAAQSIGRQTLPTLPPTLERLRQLHSSSSYSDPDSVRRGPVDRQHEVDITLTS